MYYLLKAGFKTCQYMIKTSWWVEALEYCQLLMMSIAGNPLDPAFNLYDYRIKCEDPPLCYNMSAADTFLNRPDIM